MDGGRPPRYLSRVSESTAAAQLPLALHTTLAAVARTVVPHAFEDPARGARLVRRVEVEIAALHPRKQRDLSNGLALLGSWLGALLVLRFPKPFRLQTPEVQALILERWLHSPIGLLRSVANSIRRLVLFLEYTSPEAQREVRYLGAYHTRGPAVPWEGALAGAPSDDEPIARAPMPTAAHLPPALATEVESIELPPVLPGRMDTPSRAGPDRLKAGVIVIGSGAGGAVAAARLAEAGHDVLIIEAGALLSGDDFNEDEHEMHSRLYAERGQRATDDAGLGMLQGVSVGGGTTVNWMIMLRTPDWVLEEWADYNGAEGMRPADLAPVFARIEDELHARLVPYEAQSANNRIILDGAKKLGWSAFAGKNNAKGCVRAGFCGYGCRYGAKQGGLQTYLPRAQRAGARLLANTTALKIEVVERGGSFPLKCVTLRHAPPGEAPRDLVAEAPVVVVAGGAIETPVLLQRSGMGGGGVGRYLRVHPVSAIVGRYDHEIQGASGMPLTAVCDEFIRGDGGYGSVVECPPFHPGLAATLMQEFAGVHRARMLDFPNLGSLIVIVRDGAERGHSDGDVRARKDGSVSIRYRLNPRDARQLETGLVAAARLHFAAGAREITSMHARPVVLRSPDGIEQLRGLPLGPNQVTLGSAHVNGTCRLGSDRRTAGADPHGEVYYAPGVFVADGSLLPTALGVNPQETIMALSSVVADRIAQRRRPG